MELSLLSPLLLDNKRTARPGGGTSTERWIGGRDSCTRVVSKPCSPTLCSSTCRGTFREFNAAVVRSRRERKHEPFLCGDGRRPRRREGYRRAAPRGRRGERRGRHR